MEKIKDTVLNKFAAKLLEGTLHEEIFVDSIRRIAKQIGDERLLAACEQTVEEIFNGKDFSEAMAEQGEAFSPEFLQAIKAGDLTGDRAKHLQIFLKIREHEMYDKFDQAIAGILTLAQFQDQSTATIMTALSDIAARQQTNQNLLMKILASGNQMTAIEIENLKKENTESYQEYRDTFFKVYALDLEKYQKHFSKLYELKSDQ